MVRAFPRPVTLLPTLETGPRFATVLGSPSTAVRELYSDFVPHKEPFVILGDALLCGFPALKFDKAITKFQLNVDDCPDFTKAALQVLFSSVLRKTADIHFVRLDLFLAPIARSPPFTTTRAILITSNAIPGRVL